MFDFQKINSFQVETSTYCNLACPLCPRHFMGTSVLQPGLRQRHILADQWKKFLENMDSIVTENNPCNIVFCGCHGDPCMTPDWEEIIIETAKRPYIIDVETNGSIKSAESWARVGKAMAEGEKKYPGMEKVITFSIDGLEDTNKLYRIGVKHDKVIANAKAFIEAGGRARWKYIVFKHNEHQVEEARQLAKDMGFWEFDKHVSTRNFEYNYKELEKKNQAERERLAQLPQDPARGERIAVEDLSDTVKELLPDIEIETDIKKVAKIRKGIEQEESDTKTSLNITEEGAKIFKEVVESADVSQIECDFKNDRMMYIDAEFLLWPCNHIAATKQEDMTHFNKLEKEYGVGWNSLAKHTPEEIFNHEYFQKILPLTWKDPSHKLCTYECREMCGGGISQKAWQASTNREEI